MARKLEFDNGRLTEKCEDCGKPYHPSLECPRCNP